MDFGPLRIDHLAGFASALCIVLLSIQLCIVAHASSSNTIPIEHIIIIVQENHTFDNYFGTFPEANGLNEDIFLPKSLNSSEVVRPFHLSTHKLPHDLYHGWECAHEAYNEGKMDGFVYAVGSDFTLGYYDGSDIPYYWAYASQYVLHDNFFSSVMGPSLPNFLYLLAGQSGSIVNNVAGVTFNFTSIVDELDAKKISWKYYSSTGRGILTSFSSFKANESRLGNMARSNEFFSDIKRKLANVVWILPWADEFNESPIHDITAGERWVVSLVNAIMQSKYWKSTAIFITWDDWGGWFDHVPPPQVDKFGYGFRVPLLTISPYAKQGFIDHIVGDHTSILKFVETVFSLPPLTQRDALANNLMEAFDFSQAPRAPFLLPEPQYITEHYPVTVQSIEKIEETGFELHLEIVVSGAVTVTFLSILAKRLRTPRGTNR